MIIIIGSGLAGYNLARELRALDQTTAISMITKDAGDFYSKPQLSTALANNKTAEALIATSAKVMAEKLDRNWIGTDTTKKYIEIAKNKT